MDKSAIRKFAQKARTTLIDRVKAAAYYWDITEGADPDALSAHDAPLSDTEKAQRRDILRRVDERGWDALMEEAAWTWFNRFIALRFMEANGCLPSMVRLFTDETGAFRPKILDEALDLDDKTFDKDCIGEYKRRSDDEGLYRYLFLAECRSLAPIFPGLFEKEGDWTELLFPTPLLRTGSVLESMVTAIPEDDWKDAVQILGWLYQYYNSEKKDEVFAALKKNKKIGKEDIPAATQLFTPDWIVRYMTENSLGRLWLSGHPEDRARFLPTEEEQAAYLAGGASEGASRESDDKEGKWHYYLDDAPQDEAAEAALADIRRQAARLAPEDIRVIDPCCGSGHILAYAFDLLMDIYTARSWRPRDAAASIVAHNLYGLDIDLRAAQLAYFSVMMKWVRYDRRILARLKDEAERCKWEDIPCEEKLPRPRVRAVRESNHIFDAFVSAFCGGDEMLRQDMQRLSEEMKDARTYGSLLTVGPHDWDRLYARMDAAEEETLGLKRQIETSFRPFVEAAQMLSQTYDVVITNPPYMGSNNMETALSNYLKKNFKDSKSDFSTAFMERALSMCKQAGYMTMINIPAWMFLTSYKKLREKIIKNYTFINMVHPGRGIFGSDFGTTSFVLCTAQISNYKGVYRRLFDQQGEVETVLVREQQFFSSRGTYLVNQNNFWQIPGVPIAYWASEKVIEDFKKPSLADYGVTKQGLATGNNNAFLRFWNEIDFNKIGFHCESREDAQKSKKKWFPCNKGGEFRRWYGNYDYVVNWENDGFLIQNYKDEQGKLFSRPQNMSYYFLEGLTWSSLSSYKLAMRYSPSGHIFETKGSMCFLDNLQLLYYVLGLMNSNVVDNLLRILSPTVDYHEGPVSRVPVIVDSSYFTHVTEMAKECVELSKEDWDSFETSWDFQRHPMTGGFDTVEAGYRAWQAACEERFTRLQANEEALNRIFISLYGLEGELAPDVAEKDVTVARIFDSKEDIPEAMRGSAYALTKEDTVKSLLSYAVGCVFGRYSLDAPGLVYAGGDWDEGKYGRAAPAADGLIPVLDEDYRADDLMGRFLAWLDAAYGPEHREENLRFLAAALGGKGSPRDVLRRYFFEDFFADHCRTYRKRPIYWLFDSGKKGGFRALLYIHRYGPDTAARLRTGYVHPMQQQYRAAMEALDRRLAGELPAGERAKLGKRLASLRAKDEETRSFEERLHHLADQMIPLDLDDGVKANYARLEDVLAKVK